MSLVIQIKTIVVSFLFGIYFSCFLSFCYKIIYHKKEIIKMIFTPFIILTNAFFYFLIIQKMNNGIFHIYEIFCIILGFILQGILSKFIAKRLKK